MNAYDFLLSLDRLDGRLIDETMDCLYPKERRSGKRVVRTLLIAAVLAFGVLSGFYALAGNVFAELFNLLNGHIVPYGKYMWYILAAYLFIGIFTGVFGSSISLGKYLKEHGKVVEND